MRISLRSKRYLLARRRQRVGVPKLIESRQEFLEKRLISDLKKDHLTAKKAFQTLLKKQSFFYPASILSAADKWNLDHILLSDEYNKLKEKLPIDIVSRGKVGAISKFANNGIYGVTDIGGEGRDNNEDAIAVFRYKGKTYLLLGDGVGGHKYGEIASHTALLAMLVAIEKDPNNLTAAIREAHRRVGELGAGGKKPATTLCVAMLNGQSVKVAHVGDSPIYLLKRNGTIQLLTYPHSHVGEWAINIKNGFEAIGFPEWCHTLLQAMDLSRPPYPFSLISIFIKVQKWMIHDNLFMLKRLARSLKRMVGIDIGDEIPVYPFKLNQGDRLLLASDGLDLTKVAWDRDRLDEKIFQILSQSKGLRSRVDEFMQIVKDLQTRYSDNTTALFYEG